MKKIVLFLSIALFINSLVAQNISQIENHNRVDIAVRGGINGTTFYIPQKSFDNIQEKNYHSEESMKIGAQAGLSIFVNIKPKLGIQTGLYYHYGSVAQSQSCVYEDLDKTQYSIGSKNRYKIHRVCLPLMVNYKGVGVNHFVIGAGLYADCVLHGELNYDASAVVTNPNLEQVNYFANGHFDPFTKDRKYLYYRIGNDDFSQKYRLYDENILNRFDVGACAEVGYQISKAYVGIRANMGLLNMANVRFMGESFRQHNLALHFYVGYTIN